MEFLFVRVSGRKWEDNIRLDITDIGGERVNWFYVAVDADKRVSRVDAVVIFLVHKM